MSAVRNEDTTFPVNAIVFEHLKFVEQSLRVNNHTGTQVHFFVSIQNSRGNLMQCILFSVNNNSVSGVRSTRIAHYILSIFGKVVYNFTFSFITPLGTNNYGFHFISYKHNKNVMSLCYIMGMKNCACKLQPTSYANQTQWSCCKEAT